jgi:hypothetical protein
MDEVDVKPVDLRFELRQRVQPRLAPAHVVIGCPVASQFLDRLQLYALRSICYELAARPAGRRDVAAQFFQILFRELDPERPDISRRFRTCRPHGTPFITVSSVSQRAGRFAPVKTLVGHGLYAAVTGELSVPLCLHLG